MSNPRILVSVAGSESYGTASYAVLTLASDTCRALRLRRAFAQMLFINDINFTDIAYFDGSCEWLSTAQAELVLGSLTQAAQNRVDTGYAVILPKRARVVTGHAVDYCEMHVSNTDIYFTSYPTGADTEQTTARIELSLIDKAMARF